METVLNELVKYFTQQLNMQGIPELEFTGKQAWEDAIEVCKNAIGKEKEQITGGYYAGFSDALNNDDHLFKSPDDYYNKTFKAE